MFNFDVKLAPENTILSCSLLLFMYNCQSESLTQQSYVFEDDEIVTIYVIQNSQRVIYFIIGLDIEDGYLCRRSCMVTIENIQTKVEQLCKKIKPKTKCTTVSLEWQISKKVIYNGIIIFLFELIF